MTPRLVDPAPAADVPLATESLSERAEAVAAERDVRAGVGLAEGKGRGRAGAADSGEGDDVGSGAGAAGVDLRLEKEPDGLTTFASASTSTSTLTSASELSLARQTREIASLDADFSKERNESATAAERNERGDEEYRRAQPSLMRGAAGSAAAPAGNGGGSSSSSSHSSISGGDAPAGAPDDGDGESRMSARRGGNHSAGSGGSGGDARGRGSSAKRAIVTPWGSLVEEAMLPCEREGGARGRAEERGRVGERGRGRGGGNSVRGAEWGRWGGGLGTRNGGFSVILSRGDSIEDQVVSLGGPSTAAGGEPMPPSAAVARESARAGHMGSEAVRPAPSALSSLSSSSSPASSACSSPPRLFSLCTDSIVANIHHVSSLQGLPEDIVLLLLWVSAGAAVAHTSERSTDRASAAGVPGDKAPTSGGGGGAAGAHPPLPRTDPPHSLHRQLSPLTA
ncbi:unnamed protein product [Closterium sp. NIES-54]